MSESGCLHNNKYENVKVKKHISSNDIIITESIVIDNSGIDYGVTDEGNITKILSLEHNFINTTDRASAGTIDQINPLEHDKEYLKNHIHICFNNFFSKTNQIEEGNTMRNRSFYVKWPPNTILSDLTIIPNMDIGSKAISSSEPVGTLFKNELVINLLTSDLPYSSPTDNQDHNLGTQDTINVSEQIASSNKIDKLGAQLAGHFPSPITERAGATDEKGGYAYLIREFPLIACATGSDDIIWRKYTPISVIRDNGQPIRFFGSNRNISQHSTASTTNNLKHGSIITTTKEGEDGDSGCPKGVFTTNAIRTDPTNDPKNINKNGELFSFSSTYRNVSSINYELMDSNYRDGSAQIIKNSYMTGINYIGGSIFLPTGEINVRHPLRINTKSGMFYNSSGKDIALVLTIGHTSAISITNTGNLKSSTGTLKKTSSSSPYGIDATSSFGDSNNGLRFKAIFKFTQIGRG